MTTNMNNSPQNLLKEGNSAEVDVGQEEELRD